MSDQNTLEGLSADKLLSVLRMRASKSTTDAVSRDIVQLHKELESVTSESIVREIKSKQKSIYGIDNRVDLFQVNDPDILNNADSVVALFHAEDIIDNGNGTSTLQTANFGTSHNLCEGERFRDQPVGCFCSGFLVAPDIIATAGHCTNSANVTDRRFVFGFSMLDASNAQTTVNNNEIYKGVSIIGRQQVDDGADWALVRLDRPVTNHRIVEMRVDGRIADDQEVYVIGHPAGLPTKFAGGASVRTNSPTDAFFVANLDTYGGNSGSPVFNATIHTVEGILVRGETDFVQQGTCNVSLICPSTGCRGEDCTRTTEFQQFVISTFPPNPGPLMSWDLRNISQGGHGPLAKGDSREDLVKHLQEMLIALGHNLGTSGSNADGIFGSMTETAVKQFQSLLSDFNSNALASDGLVGPLTADSINRAMLGKWYDDYTVPPILVQHYEEVRKGKKFLLPDNP